MKAPTDLRVQAEPVSDHAVAQRIRTLAQPGALGDAGMADDFRISIAGAQEKDRLVVLARLRWCRPLGATPTTHIFRLPLGLIWQPATYMQHSVEKTNGCAQSRWPPMACRVAPCEILRFEDLKTLSAQRFDRARMEW